MSGRLQGAFVRTGIVGFGLAVTAMVVLTGCSSGTTGGASPAPTSAAATTTASGGGAPKVTTTVDISKYQQNPCSGLTANQLTTFGVKDKSGIPGTMRGGTNSTLGVNCGWLTGGVTGITISYTTTNKDGLAYYYALGGTPQRLPDIDGQPALVSAPGNNGACTIAVGASDTAFYTAMIRDDNSGDPCALAQQVAAAMTQTIKSGS